MITIIPGELQIDHLRGVVYFHSAETGGTMLRICNLPAPIKRRASIDLTHNVCVYYAKIPRVKKRIGSKKK